MMPLSVGWGAVVPKPLRVDAADLVLSAALIDTVADEVRAVHADADARIEAAQSGWVGASAAAMRVKSAAWQGFTTTMYREMAGHSAKFRAAAHEFHTTDWHGAAAIDENGVPPQPDLGL